MKSHPYILLLCAALLAHSALSSIVTLSRDSADGQSYFAGLQRRLSLQSLAVPLSLSSLASEPLPGSELSFAADLPTLRANIEQYRAQNSADVSRKLSGAASGVPAAIKAAAISVYITNAEMLAQKSSAQPRALAQEKEHESGARLSEVASNRQERRLRQTRMHTDESEHAHVSGQELLKRAHEGTLFDINVEDMYAISHDDLSSFSASGNRNERR